jgi:hypothetical protein
LGWVEVRLAARGALAPVLEARPVDRVVLAALRGLAALLRLAVVLALAVVLRLAVVLALAAGLLAALALAARGLAAVDLAAVDLAAVDLADVDFAAADLAAVDFAVVGLAGVDFGVVAAVLLVAVDRPCVASGADVAEPAGVGVLSGIDPNLVASEEDRMVRGCRAGAIPCTLRH